MTKARDIANLLSTANGKIAGSNLDVSFENISDTGTEGTKVASGTTAQRGSTTGQWRFNTTTGYFEGRNNIGSFSTLEPTPTVSSVDVTEVDSQAGGNQTIVISGTNFSSGGTITFVGTSAEFNASTTTYNNATQVTAVAPKASFLNAQEPYKVKFTSSSGVAGTSATGIINVDTSPTWSTASGTLATVQDDATGTHATVSATDADGDTVAYSVQSGSIPAGTTLNTSSGTISGDPTDVATTTTSNFTLRATANTKTVDRAFSIIITPTPVTFHYLLIAGGGSGGRGYGGGGGGAGGLLTNYGSTALSIIPGTSYNVSVGAGGATAGSGNARGNSGSNSILNYHGGTLTSIGGGGGGAGQNISTSQGLEGGSGGGGGWTKTYRAGYGTYSGSSGGGIYDSSPRQGYDGIAGSVSNGSDVGGAGGGAGGAGFWTSGQNGNESSQVAAAYGGLGLQNNIDGNNYYWAGGGGGSSQYSANSAVGGNGGIGGGGGGIHDHRSNGSAGGSAINNGSGVTAGANTGSGGGAGTANTIGGVGGSGILIIRYPNTKTLTVGTLASNTITVGSDKVTYVTGTGTGTINLS